MHFPHTQHKQSHTSHHYLLRPSIKSPVRVTSTLRPVHRPNPCRAQPTIRGLRETAHHGAGHSRLDPRLRAARRPIHLALAGRSNTRLSRQRDPPTVARPSPTGRRYKGLRSAVSRSVHPFARKGEESFLFFPGRRRCVAPDLGKEIRLSASRESRVER